MKIVITDADTVFDSNVKADIFEKFGELVVYPLTSEDELCERIKDADLVLCNKTQIGKREMDAAKNLKYIGLFATGFNNIDT
ncbi:MAG: D-2-hydroxyacid dehydrogenase, partial [Clostridia bacterium]|nr:D-2-hydroxyacid dehydrogenase [Clostridia bacterium]